MGSNYCEQAKGNVAIFFNYGIRLLFIAMFCLGCAAAYGAKNGFNLIFCAVVTILFVPTIFIFYNSSAWVYAIGYGITAIIGNAIGAIFYKRAKSTKNI